MAVVIGPAVPPAIHVMTWNIRRQMPALVARRVDRWEARKPAIAALLTAEQPTVIGFQEVLPEQAQALQDILGSPYQCVGQGRGRDHVGEATPIFFDTTRLTLEGWQQYALSDHPERPGSRSWGNLFPRAFVAARFLDHQTATRFLVINTHLDHLSRRSRLRSGQAIRAFIQQCGIPAMVTGDFNTDQHSRTHRIFTGDDVLHDTWAAAARRLTTEWGTFPNYRDPTAGARIDWILNTPDWKVHRVGINAYQYAGVWASDHLPVHALLTPSRNGSHHDRQFHPPSEGVQ